ncbi:MAG: hypothetical protein ACLGHT_00495 [Acidimicrobiia bacterium]
MTDDLFSSELESDDPADGATWLLDLVAAVDHLRRGVRPGLTVWDALEEALRTDEPDWDVSDPLRTTLHEFLASTSGPADVELQAGIRRWVLANAQRFNDGHHWPHPAARRGFPAPSIDPGP